MTRNEHHPQSLLRRLLAGGMLFVFVAYLAYLPIHSFMEEHCLTDDVHAVANDHTHGDAGGETHHHQHHTSADHDVKFTGKDGSLKVLMTATSGAVRLVTPELNPAFAVWTALEWRPAGLPPGNPLVTRGPPIA